MALTDIIPDQSDPSQKGKLPNPFAAPEAAPPSLRGGLPGLGALPSLSSTNLPQAGLQPIVTNPRQQQEQQLQAKIGAYENPSQSPQGFWGKLRHGLALAGNIAGDAVDPRLMQQIPGTEAYKASQHAQNVRELAGLQVQDTEEQNAASKRTLESAQTAEAGARTNEIENPQAKPVDLAQAYANAVQSVINSGGDPTQDPVVQHLSDAITQIQKQPTAKPANKTVPLEINGKPHQVLIDEGTGQTVRDLGETGEKPPTVNVNAGNAALDRESSRFAKTWETASTSANAQLDKISDAESMISGNATSQALGIPKLLTALVSGQGSGVRITQAELNSIAKARGLAADVEGTIRKWSGQGSLTPEQQKQAVGILEDVKQRIIQKQQIANEALDRINTGGSRDDIIKADKEARDKLGSFERGQTQSGGQMIRARDPQGKLHEAPAGTPLPSGWKEEKQ